MLAQLFAVLAAVSVLALVCLLLLGWGGLLKITPRIGLATFASGLLLAAPARFRGEPAGWADFMMLVGLALYFGGTYVPRILEHVDGLDGKVDGRLSVRRIPWGRG